jgi:molybdenum cofactor biosynthesis enzyme MoaA
MTTKYLRIVVTPTCTLQCSFCHMEGDVAVQGRQAGVPRAELVRLVAVGYQEGVRKVKLLGGEPLIRADLPQLIAELLAATGPDLDLSLITAGVVPVKNLHAAFAAGLQRANLSIHGWSAEALARNTKTRDAWAMRQRNLDALLAYGRPLKCNYVYTGPEVEADLAEFLRWAADKPLTVAVLDDLGVDQDGPAVVRAALMRMHGPWQESLREEDPNSLPTQRLHWADGLVVEVKDHQLGQVAPWQACGACPVRSRCKEGIHALRLSHTGDLRPCMDRPELGSDVLALLKSGGEAAVQQAWQQLHAA